MRFLLISPPSIFCRGSHKPTLALPVGILYVAAAIEKAGHEVEVYDARASCRVHGFKDGIFLFGDDFKTIEEKIRNSGAEIVGVGAPFTVIYNSAIRVVEIAKRCGKKVIVGGADATVRHEKYEIADHVCRGEGEPFVAEMFGRPRPERMDDIPLPAYHKVDVEKYMSGRFAPRSELTGRAIPIITSRGCPFNCAFCSVHLQFGRNWRGHSPEYVLEHIKFLVEKHGVKLIHLEDDNISADKARFEKILDMLIEADLGVHLDTPNGVRLDTLDENILRKCKRAKFDYLVIAPESGNQRVLDEVIDKKLDLKKAEEIAALCKKIGLELEAFYVVGSPGETLGEMEQTFRFARMMHKKYNVFPMYDIITPLPGTRLWGECESKGYFAAEPTPENLLRSQHSRSIIETPDFSPDDIERLFRKYRLFILWTRVKKALRHPRLLKSYVNKILKIRLGGES